MRVAKKSDFAERLTNKYYSFDYISFIIQCFIRRGLRMKAVNIVSIFLYKLKIYFSLKGSLNKLLFNIFEKYVPVISFVARKVAATVYMLPWFINRNRARSLLIHWFLLSVLERTENKIVDRFFNEFMEIYKGYGRTIRKVEDYYNIAIKNRPFMRFLKKRNKRFLGRLKKYGVRLR